MMKNKGISLFSGGSIFFCRKYQQHQLLGYFFPSRLKLAKRQQPPVRKHFYACLSAGVLLFITSVFHTCPASAQNLLANIDFSDSAAQLRNFYIEAGYPYSFNIADSVERDGNPSGRFELRYGDKAIDGGTRSEISGPMNVTIGKEIWFGFSLYLPAYAWGPDVQQEITGQLHDVSNMDISPPVAMVHQNGHTYINVDYTNNPNPSYANLTYLVYDLGPTITNQWVDYVFHAKLDTGKAGIVQIWQNGVLVVNRAGGVGYITSQSLYPKAGIYKWYWSQTGPSNVSKRVAYYDDIKVADGTGSYSLVAPPSSAATNQPPVANAGSDTTITLPVNSLTLNGIASYDPDGTITSYNWTKLSGPAVTIANANTQQAKLNNLVAGQYQFTLTVTDNNGASNTDTVAVTVNPAANQPPVANAGVTQTITLPRDSVYITGSQSADKDGTITAYNWQQLSGPSTAYIESPKAVATTVNSLTTGTYFFLLTVTDNQGATDTASVMIIVNAAANQPPVANAGNNISITLPIDSVKLNGTASTDPDGTIVSYQWKKVSGPGSYSFTDSSLVNPTVYNLVVGKYVFFLTVTDNNGATSGSSVSVLVNPALDIPPVANAGSNVTITLPDDSVILNGTASSDTDGNIIAYNWQVLSGPASYIMQDSNAAVTTISNLTTGIYSIELTVTDNSGATSVAQISITVKAAANKPPVANAGANIIVVLPDNNATLNGSRSYDGDGYITNYKWSEISGPSVYTMTSYDSSVANLYNLVTGTYVFSLTVTDNDGATDSAFVSITVKPDPNQPPVANAGSDTTIMLPQDSVILNGSYSYDPDGSITHYSWKELSGPSEFSMNNTDSSKVIISDLVAGNYVFQLTVTDDKGAIASDTIVINVAASNSQLSNGSMTLYPNPARNNMHIFFYSQGQGPIVLSIYDLSGKLWATYQERKDNKFEFHQAMDISNLTPGMYILHLNFNNIYSVSSKFVKM